MRLIVNIKSFWGSRDLFSKRPLVFLFLFFFSFFVQAAERVVIIMDVDTGQVVYLENPSGAVEKAYSPGSVIKVFSALYGLKENLFSPVETVFCKGRFEVEGDEFNCWDKVGHGPMNLSAALAYSCNMFFYLQASRFDSDVFSGYIQFLHRLGFGEKTGIDISNENPGLISSIVEKKEQVKAFAGSTLKIKVTPIQVITAFSILANGGKRLKPFYRNGVPVVIENFDLGSHIEFIRTALQEGSTNGTSSGYFQETQGFAKTGTAPQEDGVYSHAWFVGYFPFETRKFAVLVFKNNGTGAKDAMPDAFRVIKNFKYSLQDQEPVTVSLFSKVKPRTVTVNGRFGFLLLRGDTDSSIPELDIQCKTLKVDYRGNSSIRVMVDGKESDFYHFVEIQSSHPNGLINLSTPGIPLKDYKGSISIRSNGRFLEIINTVELKDYLIGVIGEEIGYLHDSEVLTHKQVRYNSSHEEVLKCQAILSRTFSLKNRGRHRDYDFCDTTHCQYYTGLPVQSEATGKAITDTAGLVLTYNGELCDIFYHSTCGGSTDDYKGVWEDREIPYLQSVIEKYQCRRSPHFRWKVTIEPNRFLTVLKEITGEMPVDFRISKVNSSGWVKQVKLFFKGGKEKTLRGEAFHIQMGRKLGWNVFKSANFSIMKNGTFWEFSGKGLGHGVGLCQYGAKALAQKGKPYPYILNFYFPGTVLSPYLNF